MRLRQGRQVGSTGAELAGGGGSCCRCSATELGMRPGNGLRVEEEVNIYLQPAYFPGQRGLWVGGSLSGLGIWDRAMREKGSLEGEICVIHWRWG